MEKSIFHKIFASRYECIYRARDITLTPACTIGGSHFRVPLGTFYFLSPDKVSHEVLMKLPDDEKRKLQRRRQR